MPEPMSHALPQTLSPALDRELALARVGGDAELLRELAALFLEEYPRVLLELHHALNRGDAHAIERAAHGLKGSVATLGGLPAMELARLIEFLGRDQKLDEAKQALHTLEIALVALRTELASL